MDHKWRTFFDDGAPKYWKRKFAESDPSGDLPHAQNKGKGNQNVSEHCQTVVVLNVQGPKFSSLSQ